MQMFANHPLIWCFPAILVILAGCSDSSGGRPDDGGESLPAEPELLPISQPTVENPPELGDLSLLSTTFDLSIVGYEQREFFLSGKATAFTNVNELGVDGLWEAEPASEADYKTRAVVYRPTDPADFSGVVYVEWLNVTAGFDTPPSWGSGHVELLRSGHAWIGVSAQIVGIEGADRGLIPLHLKEVNPDRYGDLLHPGDSYSYDMFSQVAQALREPGEIDLLEGLAPSKLIAMGESQSAARLATYINAVHPLYNPYDGYMIHSRGGRASPLSQDPQPEIEPPDGTKIRTDLNVPVMNFQTETDVLELGSLAARQGDSTRFRLWEAAGTAHGDYYSFIAGRADFGEGAEFAVVVEVDSILGFIQCDRPMNSGPMAWLFSASINALTAWVVDGTEPPRADRFNINDDETAFVFDDLGNVTGGIRNPYVDAPAARLSGEANTGFPDHHRFNDRLRYARVGFPIDNAVGPLRRHSYRCVSIQSLLSPRTNNSNDRYLLACVRFQSVPHLRPPQRAKFSCGSGTSAPFVQYQPRPGLVPGQTSAGNGLSRPQTAR